MLNENAKKWVEALRSGKYQQGTSRLRDRSDRFCCLGVGCDVAVGSGLTVILSSDENEFSYDEYSGTLPPHVQKWLGLASDNGRMADGHTLIWANDVHGKSFAQIADIIESEPEGLFA